MLLSCRALSRLCLPGGCISNGQGPDEKVPHRRGPLGHLDTTALGHPICWPVSLPRLLPALMSALRCVRKHSVCVICQLNGNWQPGWAPSQLSKLVSLRPRQRLESSRVVVMGTLEASGLHVNARGSSHSHSMLQVAGFAVQRSDAQEAWATLDPCEAFLSLDSRCLS